MTSTKETIKEHARRAIWQVFPVTPGTAGAYIDALQSASHKANIRSYAIVSRWYAYNTKNVVMLFLPLTDRTKKRNTLIRVVRGSELLAGYVLVWLAALVMRPVVSIHMAGIFWFVWFFFHLCKLARLRVCVTCHDVANGNLKMTEQRLHMLRAADRLVVHSSAARRLLLGYLGDEGADRIVQYSFPFSSYDSILSQEKMRTSAMTLDDAVGDADADIFSFIGVVRPAKGIETLVKAWKTCRDRQKARLLIAGKWAGMPQATRDEVDELENCVVLDRFLTDEEFVYSIRMSKFVVFPYLSYSHSSVLISCARHNGAVIISDIELFREFLPDYDLTFPCGDSARLAALLDKAAALSKEEREIRAKQLRDAVEEHDKRLVTGLIHAYEL